MRYIIIALVLLCYSVPAIAADVYVSTTGTRTTGKSTPGDWSNANCYNNLYAAFNAMSSGDTLAIDDGDYTSHWNTIGWNDTRTAVQVPPSGSGTGSGNARFTVIRAKNIPCQDGVSCSQPLKVRFTGAAVFNGNNHGTPPAWLKFWGIRWDGITTYTGWNHIYFKQVASQGINDGNSAAFSINGQYNLLEDCVAYGKGRYKFLFYDFSRELQTYGAGNNVCRRCVARHDWAKKEDATGDPIATFASYYNRGTALLNCIDIDSNLPAYWMNTPGEFSGAFYQPVDSGPHALTVKGSIVLNSAMGISNLRNGSTGHILQDVVGVKVAGGIGAQGAVDIQRLTLYNVGTNNFTYRSTTQSSQILTPDYGVNNWSGIDGTSLYNSILFGINGNGTNITSDYIATNAITGTAFTSTPDHIFTGTQTASLKYPIRIEAGSTLATAGSGGGQIGARIINRIGVDGTFKNETGWDVEQTNSPLWPWPSEAWIQAEMRTSDFTSFCAPYAGTDTPCPASYATDASRGFCATGQTLTKYIWESLGNPIPADIYGGVVTGICGSSNGLSLSTAPSTGLCSAGTASAVTGTGPFLWTCAGSGGGSTANCGATVLEVPPTGNASSLVACPVIAGFR